MPGPRVASVRKRRERIADLQPLLGALYPDLTVSLDWGTPLQLLVATILSAQCTDERVNRVTPGLFARYPDAEALAAAERTELEELIRSTGFYRNKAKNIQGMAKRLVAEHGGAVPDTMDELLQLPGVARKTANVVLSNAFGRNEGVVVDTHVKRVAARLGLTSHTDPVRIERDLMELLDRDRWHSFPWRLILHGRQRCHARKPDCAGCEVRHLCPSAGRV
ncbi:MAG: endonuclease III [Candidatus Palauibacterales bacterium]|jgi:endonuclease III|nr:endonuclease III [Candidatus Palauibacterales bacterium]MDP2482830.1 endonuclease III [Candidatus Palauibacterales bacterium]